MPDWFFGKPLDKKSHPPKTDEQKQKLGEFFAGPANPTATAGKIPAVMEELRSVAPNVTKWGVLGMCWGGKV